MSKLRATPITADELLAFVETSSDFAFELSILPLLAQHGFTFEHGGTYTDPHTDKPRQYDIRAAHVSTPLGPRTLTYAIRLAVECKNLQPNNPLLVSCVPRKEREAWEQLILAKESGSIHEDPGAHPMIL